MVEIADIKDAKSLEAWLEDQPRWVSVWITFRIAARVLPDWWMAVMTEDWARKRDLTPLPSLRNLLISSTAAILPTDSLRDAAAAASAGGSIGGRYIVLNAADIAYLGIKVAAADTGAALKAAFAAEAAESIDTAVWQSIRIDAGHVVDSMIPVALTLWSNGSGEQANKWARIKAHVAEAPDAADWQFWIDWYDALLAGRTLLPDTKRTWDMLEKIALIDPKTWDAGPETVNPLIREIWESYQGTPLAEAAIVDFDFNVALQQMDVVGFDDDLAHLKDPETVAAFVDDIDELQDGLQDFLDFSEQERRNSNALPMLGRAAEKVLDELRRTRDKTHIRARRLVVLGGYLYSFSLEEDKRDELGDTLTNMLDRNVGLLQSTCKKHLAPSLARLDSLSTLERGENAPEDMLATMRKALDTLRAADGQDMARLSPEGRAILGEMVSELEELVTAADAASTPERRDTLLARFTRGYGGVSATFGRYVEKARPYREKVTEGVDQLTKNFRRWKSIEDMLKFLEDLGRNGPPPS